MVATRTSAGPVPPIVRIRRAPAFEPPTDDARRGDEHPVCAGQLALFTSVGRRPGGRYPGQRGDPAARRRVAADGWPTDQPYQPAAGAPPAGPARTVPPAPYSPPDRGSPRAAAHRFVTGCVEVLNGVRPAAHLRSMSSPAGYGSIVRQLTRRAARVRMPTRPAGQPVTLHGLRVFEQRTGWAEAVAVLRNGEACWAVALHFEHRPGGWQCTLLEVI